MTLLGVLPAQPMQALALLATDLVPAVKGLNQVHVRLELGHHGHLPTFADFFFGPLVNVTQISGHNGWSPPQALVTVMKAGREQITRWDVGRSGPTDQRNQEHRPGVGPEP